MNKTSMIPKITHFIWLGSKEPESGVDMMDRFAELHDGWKIEVWSENRILDAMHGLPDLQELWRKFHGNFKMQVMVAKLTVLWTMGGVVLDLDLYVVRSLDSLLDKKKDNFFSSDYSGKAVTCAMASVPAHSLIALAIKVGLEKDVKNPQSWLYAVRDTWPRPRMNVVPDHYFCPIRVKSEARTFLRKWPSDQAVDLEKRKKRFSDKEMPYAVHCFGAGFLLPPLYDRPYQNEATAYPKKDYEIIDIPPELQAQMLTEDTIIDDGKKAGWFRKTVNVLEAAGRATKAIVKRQKLTVGSEEVARRLNVCKTSGEGGGPCHYLNGGTCTKCGCILSFKHKLATESCPIGRW